MLFFVIGASAYRCEMKFQTVSLNSTMILTRRNEMILPFYCVWGFAECVGMLAAGI